MGPSQVEPRKADQRNEIMLRVIIIASGKEYQRAAAFAASTFTIHARVPDSVSVLIPSGEKKTSFLGRSSGKYGFLIEKFPFTAQRPEYFTSQLKCQALAWRVTHLERKEIALFTDADTCCLKPIRLSKDTRVEFMAGHIGLVPDIEDRHFKDSSVPWYLAPKERSVYVNSGVIFASRRAHSFFEHVRRLSEEPRFFSGPFNDQKVINFALGKYYPGLLVSMDRKFNSIGSMQKKTVIAHFAGGAGFLAQQRRRVDHEQMCKNVCLKILHPKILTQLKHCVLHR